MLLRNNQSGQALMIVLLALAAVASVALTISTRSTTDISVTTNVEDSQRAFTAAEAGIEKVLLDETAAIGGSLEENVGDAGASFTANADTIPEDPQAYAYPFKVAAGDVATLWFMSHDENGQLSCAGLPCYTATNIRVCWGEDGALPVDAGAVEITVYSQNSAGQIIASRTTLDEDLPRLNESGFEAGNEGDCGTIDGQQYAISRSLNFSVDLGISNAATAGALKMLRMRLLYNNEPQPVAFKTDGAGNLPVQGVRVDSVGSAGTSSRRLEAFSLFPAVPGMFEAALFSPPGAVKN